MNDLIDRQNAIDKLEARKDKTAKGYIGSFYNTIIQQDIDALEDLPSEQPERILEEAKTNIKKEIKDLKEAGKYHADFVSDNGDLVIMGLMAALKILERCESRGEADDE